MSSHRDTLGYQAEMKEKENIRETRDNSAVEQRLERLDTYLDVCTDFLSQLESRLNPVLPPSYFNDVGKTDKLAEPSLPSSPLVCELERISYRLDTVTHRLNELLEHMEI